MNVNNQPSFGANFKWANKKSPEIVAKRLLGEQSSKITAAIEKSKTHGGYDITHALGVHIFETINADNPMYDYKGILTLPNDQKRIITNNAQIDGPTDFAIFAQNAAEAFAAVKKHNLSQRKINGFNTPAEIIEYGKQLDLEG